MLAFGNYEKLKYLRVNMFENILWNKNNKKKKKIIARSCIPIEIILRKSRVWNVLADWNNIEWKDI